jgi:hypothetical protein
VRVLQRVAAVNDGTATDLVFQASTTQLSANWPAVTGAADYEYAFGSTPGGSDPVAWTSSAGGLSAIGPNLSLTPGATYYASARVVYSGGQRSIPTSSNGVGIITAPTGVSASAGDPSAPISGTWNAVMGAAGYEYAIGSAPGATDMSTWTNNGVASVFARGGLSLSVGQTYDASAPEVAGARPNRQSNQPRPMPRPRTPPPSPTRSPLPS